eukprot:INCI7230.14.p1 GENE.INCI7230.14~~INCI7230.14.p1  ORF type:complete len:324 (+),score=34.49 INCI7230.14:347-1318(+)
MDAKAEVRSVDRSAQLCEAHRQPSSCCCTLPRVSVQTRKAYGSTAGGCPGASIRKEQPLIQSYSHFFSREECTEVIELARAKGFRRAKTRSKTLTSGRTNSSAWLPHDASPALWQLTQRVADCVGLPTFVAEQWQVIHYRAEGREEYRRHYDSYSPDDPGCHENLARSGNRLVTCLGYLNDLPAGGGGETKFVALPSPIAVRPETGKLLIFHNCEGNRSALSFVPPGGRHPPVERDSTIHTDKAVRGDSAYDHCWAYGPQEDLLNVQQDGVKYAAKRHELSEHCGMPVLKGEKYAFNLWFRERPTHGVRLAARVGYERTPFRE